MILKRANRCIMCKRTIRHWNKSKLCCSCKNKINSENYYYKIVTTKN